MQAYSHDQFQMVLQKAFRAWCELGVSGVTIMGAIHGLDLPSQGVEAH
jgi:hypothetical protein